MALRVEFINIKNSDKVKDHINELMKELRSITDDRYTFKFKLVKEANESYSSHVNCTFLNKPMISNTTDNNLYKAISKSVDQIKTQVIKKAEKTRKAG